MTESDVLARAARALREAHTGEREGSGFTRARIMSSVHRERRRRTLRWAILSPLASVLLVGSAWAQSTGKWPVIWQAVTSVFVSAPAPAPSPSSPSSRREASHPRHEPAAPGPELASEAEDQAAPAAPPALEPTQDAAPESAAPPEQAEHRSRKPVRRRRPPTPRAAPANPSSIEPDAAAAARENAVVPEPERDRELGRFRRAHDLHFEGSAREAIAAYAEYLRQYPAGRFVPEARYAMALDHIKLGDDAAAREALAPFAAGRYGGYRQKEAQKLLRALEEKTKPASR